MDLMLPGDEWLPVALNACTFELSAAQSTARSAARGHTAGALRLGPDAACSTAHSTRAAAPPAASGLRFSSSDGSDDGLPPPLPSLDQAEQPAFAPPDPSLPASNGAAEDPPVPVIYLGKCYSAIPAGRPTLAPHALYLAQVAEGRAAAVPCMTGPVRPRCWPACCVSLVPSITRAACLLLRCCRSLACPLEGGALRRRQWALARRSAGA